MDSTHVQYVVDAQTRPSLPEQIAALTRESAIRVEGLVSRNPGVRLGGIEVQTETIETLSLADYTLPIDPTIAEPPGVEARMDWRFLDLRRPEHRLIFEIQTGGRVGHADLLEGERIPQDTNAKTDGDSQ